MERSGDVINYRVLVFIIVIIVVVINVFVIVVVIAVCSDRASGILGSGWLSRFVESLVKGVRKQLMYSTW